MKAVFNENAPRGHYSLGMLCGQPLYISGQTSADPTTGLPAEGGFEAEMEMALLKLESVLTAVGCNRSSVVMCRIYLPSMDLWERTNRVCKQFGRGCSPCAAQKLQRSLSHLIDIGMRRTIIEV